MALVVFCGQPCSGKSTIAASLVKSLTDEGLSIKLIDEPTLNLDRTKSYSGQFVYTTLKIVYVSYHIGMFIIVVVFSQACQLRKI